MPRTGKPRGRPKGQKNLSPEKIRGILVRVAKTKSKSQVAKETGLSISTVDNIIAREHDKFEIIKEKIGETITDLSGECGVLALNALKNKSLKSERPATLSRIAKEMSDVYRGTGAVQVQINNAMPSNRDDMIAFLTGKSANICNTIDNSTIDKPVDNPQSQDQIDNSTSSND